MSRLSGLKNDAWRVVRSPENKKRDRNNGTLTKSKREILRVLAFYPAVEILKHSDVAIGVSRCPE